MNCGLRTALVLGFCTVGFLTCSAQAEFLPNVSNLNFVDYTGVAPKATFSAVNPVGWTGGGDGALIFIDGPGAPGCAACADGPTYLQTYGPFPAPPIAGNYVEADGNPDYTTGFSQLITGLTAGHTYTLSFYQAGGQQAGFANGLNTTEQWVVSLGTHGLDVCSGCGAADPYYSGHDGTYSNADPTASIALTNAMVTAPGGVSPWEYVSVDLTADSDSDLLSFLAWGDNGSNVNLPPIVFLSGVNSVDVISPEPASFVLGGTALLALGFGAAIRRRRVSQN